MLNDLCWQWLIDCRRRRKPTCMWSSRSWIVAHSFVDLDSETTAQAMPDLSRRIDCRTYRRWEKDVSRTLLQSFSARIGCHIKSRHHGIITTTTARSSLESGFWGLETGVSARLQRALQHDRFLNSHQFSKNEEERLLRSPNIRRSLASSVRIAHDGEKKSQ